jgi:sugar-specific transcriptional regulator TrmB
MSLERMLDTLVSLGLTRTEAQAYVFLAKKSPQTGKELANALKITKPQLYRSLRRLRAKGMVNASPQRPAQYSVVSLEKVLELYAEAMMEQAKALQASRKELLTAWRSAIGKDSAKS